MTAFPEASKQGIIVPRGVGPLLDPAADLGWKRDHAVNSWFAIGHFVNGADILDYLFHLMILPIPGGGRVLQGVVSITNETTGWYRGDDVIVPVDEAEISESDFDIALPNGRMRGSLHDLHVEARLADGAGSIDMDLAIASPVILNGGSGIFPMVGTSFNQYSVPRLTSRGTITIEGRAHKVDGVSWFDRQWQHEPGGPAGESLNGLKWSWMDINLENGDAVSLWSGPTVVGGEERAWATVLHADGSQTVAAVEPGLGADDYWQSDESGARYPTRWTVRIPALDAVLQVVPRPRRQEIVSKVPLLNKYEGASEMTGTWRGEPAKGFGYVELVGIWK
jgi:predicted secreted hydrolase